MAQRTVSVVLSAEVMGYEQAMGRASKATSNVADAGDKATTKLKNGFDSTAKVAGTVFNTTVAASGVLVTNLAKTGVAYNSLQQNSRAALETLLGSTEAVNAQMEKMDAFASKSPFSKAIFLEAQQSMIGFGVAAERVIPALDAIQNAVASQGKGSAEIERATYALSQMQSMGKYTGETIRDLGVLGIDTTSILAEHFGTTSAEIREMASKPGGIPVEEIWDPLINGMTEKFGGATTKIKEQWTGAKDRIGAAAREIGARMMEPFVSQQGGGMAVTWANDFANALGAVRDKTEMVTNAVVRRLQPGLDQITPTFQSITKVIQSISFDNINTGLDKLAKYAVPLSGIAGYLGAMGTQWPLLQKLGLSLNPVLGAMIGITAASPALRSAIGNVWKSFEPAVTAAGQLAIILADLTSQVVDAAAPGIESFGTAIAKGIVALTDMTMAATPVTSALVPIVSGISGIVTAISSLPTPVLLGAAAFLALRKPMSDLPGLFSNVTEKINGVVAANANLSMAKGHLSAIRSDWQNYGQTVFMVSSSGATQAENMSSRMGSAFGRIKSSGGYAFKALGSSIVGAFGGPVIFAATAGIAGLTAVLSASAESARKAEQTAKDYADTLDQVTGAVTGATESLMIDRLIDEGWADKIEGFGGDLKTSIEVMKGVEGSKQELQAQMRKAYANDDSIDTGDYHDFIVWASAQGHVIDAQKDSIRQKNAASTEGADAEKTHADALRDAASAADEARRAMQEKANADRAAVDAVYAIQDAQARLDEAIQNGAQLTRDGAGNLDLYSASSREAVEPLESLIDGINRKRQALVDQKAPQEEINAYIAESNQLFYDEATAAGAAATETGNFGGEVSELAGNLGLIPDYQSKIIDMTVESEAAQQDIQSLTESVASAQDQGGLITFQADSSPALDELFTTMGLVRDSKGDITVDANKNPAIAQLLIALGQVDTSTGTVSIDGNNSFVNQKASEAVGSINSKSGSISIYGEDYATAEANSIAARINGITATIKVLANTALSASSANGNVFSSMQAFANGSENHVAQIGSPGLMRIWNEPETGGEAYIPLSPAKRARSMQILDHVARAFGQNLVPLGAQAFANGSIGTLSSQPALTQPVIEVQATVMNPWTGKQMKAEIQNIVIRTSQGQG